MTQRDELILKLKDAGYKITGQRKQFLEAFLQAGEKYLSAKELHEFLSKAYPNISYDTIYRTLATLQDIGVIEEMEFSDSGSRFRLACNEGHHHHLVCLDCGNSSSLMHCPIEQLTDQLTDQLKGFKLVDHRLELYGYCSDCTGEEREGS